MAFSHIPQIPKDIESHIKSFLAPRDLMRLERVSKASKASPREWKKIGYEDKEDCKKITEALVKFCSDDNKKKVIKEFILSGRINGKQAKEILEQDFYGKQWCTNLFGIQAISLGIFSPKDIANMEDYTRQHCLSKNGFKLIKRGILTPGEIGQMDAYIRQRVLSDKGTKMIIDGEIKKEELGSMSVKQLDDILKSQ